MKNTLHTFSSFWNHFETSKNYIFKVQKLIVEIVKTILSEKNMLDSVTQPRTLQTIDP